MSDNQLRETILRFYAVMTDRSYDDVSDEYLLRGEKHRLTSNKLYMAVEYAIAQCRAGEDKISDNLPEDVAIWRNPSKKIDKEAVWPLAQRIAEGLELKQPTSPNPSPSRGLEEFNK